MALKLLTPEQVRSMSLEEKDEWWLKNVYRGDMPQLTLRSALTGVALGSVLSLTNLYIATRTGWLLGVGITSVVLSFAAFKTLSKAGVAREMTVLENNAMQSIATAAGYMTAPLVSSLAAYTMVTGKIVPMHVAIAWMICLAALGILFAFPMKKRFINDEQQPFPEGMAAGVVMDSLHQSDAREGMRKAKLLAAGAAASALIEVLRNDKLMRLIAAVRAFPTYYDDFIYRLGVTPKILGTPLSNLTIRFDTSIIFVATGGLTGIRTGVSMLIGAILNYAVLAPILIQRGVILPGESGQVGFEEITIWGLWGGVALMTTGSLYAFFSKPQVLLAAVGGLFAKKIGARRDVLAHIELPIRLSLIGVPIVGLVMALMGYFWFDMSIAMGIIAVPLVFIFSLIAVSSTALTSITPSSALAQLTQLTYGLLSPGNITTNLVSAGITSEVSAHASNLLMDIKPGYMLGAKPRQQAIGHFLGAFAGLIIAVPIWYLFIIAGDVSRYGTEALPVPSAVVWKAVSEILMKGLGFLHPTARAAVVVGAVLGIVVEASKQITKGRFPLSAIGLGLPFVLRFADVFTMFLGSLIFWLIERRAGGPAGTEVSSEAPELVVPAKVAPVEASPVDGAAAGEAEEPAKAGAPGPSEGPAKRPWYVTVNENRETICAGVIAGGSLTGIGLTIAVLKIPDVLPVQGVGPGIAKVAAALLGGG
jgi:uncharacterized oligopeptide transporter (OPT) family protein